MFKNVLKHTKLTGTTLHNYTYTLDIQNGKDHDDDINIHGCTLQLRDMNDPNIRPCKTENGL